MAIPAQCRKLKGAVDSLTTQLHTAQTNLTQTKSEYWAGEVKDLLAKLKQAKQKLKKCLDDAAGITPPGPSHPYDGVPFVNPCQKLKNASDAAQTELDTAYANFAQNPKDSYLKEVLDNAKVKATSANGAYLDCVQAHTPQAGLVSNIAGLATLTTDYAAAAGPFKQSFIGTVFFKPPFHQEVSLNSLVPILILITSPPAPFQVTVTITFSGVSKGTYDPGTGAMAISIPLLFSYSAAGATADIIALNVSSAAAGGSAFDTLGNVTVVGGGTFTNGFLAGEDIVGPSQPTEATISLAATVVPHPYVA